LGGVLVGKVDGRAFCKRKMSLRVAKFSKMAAGRLKVFALLRLVGDFSEEIADAKGRGRDKSTQMSRWHLGRHLGNGRKTIRKRYSSIALNFLIF
jgi:hypothetical protein